MLMFLPVLSLLISASLATGGWGRGSSLRRGGEGEGTYNPKSAWMFVDSRRRVLPDIDGRVVLVKRGHLGHVKTVVLVESHFASVENNILSDIRNFHMKMIKAKVDNTTAEIVELPQTNQDQYRISSFVPERRRWSSKVVTFISSHHY